MLATAGTNSMEAQNDSTSVSHLDNVVVTGTRAATTSRNLPVTVSVVSRDKLTENHRTNILPTLTEQVPGLFVTQRGMLGYGVSDGAAGGISIRGLQAGMGRVIVLIDGHPQYQGIFGHSIADSYQTMMTERVEVVRSPASVLYGSNAMAGVINIVTRKSKEDGVYTHLNIGAGSWGTVEGEISNVIRHGRFTSTIAAQYSRSDNHRPNMGFEQEGAFVKLGYDLSSHWNAFADLDITHFNASYAGSLTQPLQEADQWITRGAATIGFENDYGWTSGRISAYDNFGFHKINDGYGPFKNNNVPQTELFRSKDALAGASWYQTLKVITGNSITVGVDYQHIYGHAYYTSRETGDIVTSGRRGKQSTNTHNNEIAGYVDVRQDIASWLTLDAGVRYDHHSTVGNEWIPQFGLVVRPTATTELKATASKGFRNPSTKDLYLYGSANIDLLPERLWSYELAWNHTLKGGDLTYGVNLFMLNADNLIQTVEQKNINTGEVKNKGVEASAAYRINSHWTLNTNHSYLHMKYHLVGAPTYKGYLGANTRYGKFTASAGLQYINGLYTSTNEDNPDDDIKTSFTLLNVTLGYQALDNLNLWIKGDNLLAQNYEINLGYPMPRATFMAGVSVKF